MKPGGCCSFSAGAPAFGAHRWWRMVLQETERGNPGPLADMLDRILDKGLVINADITVSVVGVELLGIKIRAALASFETAARYGLEFPSMTSLETPAWKEAMVGKETCPQ